MSDLSSPAQYFRAGVGAVIINGNRLVLALERTDLPGAWQLPQGGIESSEEPLRAAYREIAEETGISESDLKLLDLYPEPLVYELPLSAQSEKTGRGQVQYWFLFRFQGNDNKINTKSGGEFRAWKWIRFIDLLNLVIDFRRRSYQKLANQFSKYMS